MADKGWPVAVPTRRAGGSWAMSELPAPAGWFAVAFSDELGSGAVLTRLLAGSEVVVWRGQDGAVAALDPTCPHLGAHLGDGRVAASTLRCAFHGFGFAADGRCVHSSGGGPAPSGLGVRAWPVCEREGAVLVWHHPTGAPPSFVVPEVDHPPATALVTARFELPGHPLATCENTVDVSHLAEVHRYGAVRALAPFRPEGPVATASYEMRRPLGGLERLPGLRRLTMRARFDVTLYGLGVSVVEATLPGLDIRTRQLVLSTPTAPGRIELRLGVRLLRRSRAGAAARLLERVGARLAMSAFAHDVRQDLAIWSRQRYVPTPGLGRGDGPIIPYRRWAQQFLTSPVAGRSAGGES